MGFLCKDAGTKLNDSDKATIRDQSSSVLQWLDANSLADKEEYDDKYKELSKVCSPIMSKLHGAQGQAQGPGGKGPTVEEVD